MSKEKKQKTRTDIADSLKAAASILNYKVEWLKAAKDAGCPAFRYSKVYLKELKKWFVENPLQEIEIDGKTNWEIERIKRQVKALDFRYEVDRGNYTENSKIIESITGIAEHAKAVLRQKLEVEYPALVEGMNAAEIRKKGMELVDEILGILSKGSEKWTQ